LVCNNPKAAEEVLDALPIKPDPLREHRLKAMLGKPQMNAETLKANTQWQTISQQINQMTHEPA
jgi:beta-N-acetylhexosaminidase